VSQNPSRETGITASEVHRSKISATAPPCRLPPALHKIGVTMHENVAKAMLGSVGCWRADKGVMEPARTESKCYMPVRTCNVS